MLEEFRRLARHEPRTLEEETTALTQREQEVLSLVAEGATDKEIAQALSLSIHTIKSHMRNILSKLHLSHRHEAAVYALREGLINPATKKKFNLDNASLKGGQWGQIPPLFMTSFNN
jgi:DNA-binding NarL/FixJ family response regulator